MLWEKTLFVPSPKYDEQMDKSKWPQSWKDQYNEQIRLRKIAAKLKAIREELRDAREFPQIWQFNLNEETVFSLIAYDFKLHRTLNLLLQRFISPGLEDELRLSSSYLFNTEKIFPAYYSDRERAVVMLNRFKASKDMEELFKWVSFFTHQGYHPYLHLLLGVLFLDRYLSQLNQKIWLQEAIQHLRRVGNWVRNHDCQKALSAVQALAWYLNQDFEKASGCLKLKENESFEKEFAELIQKMAA